MKQNILSFYPTSIFTVYENLSRPDNPPQFSPNFPASGHKCTCIELEQQLIQ